MPKTPPEELLRYVARQISRGIRNKDWSDIGLAKMRLQNEGYLPKDREPAGTSTSE